MEFIDRQSFTVLVAEDNPDARSIFADVLQMSGYRVVTAANGAEALRIVRDGGVHVILTDMRMPVMDGLDLAMVVRNELSHIPIVLLSATPLPNTWAVLNVFAASLVKPCPIEDLVAAIDRQVQTI
ncbi:response regulator [Herbaspirillum lusitanum]|uniref:response regulator n=1 Tax=Herbaspirillum lusitanum TaxID=213312 RepID=UPI0022372260|nr:response regulator [Herbaspirillum lusitanum]MCW5299256.1 response regulator [Herbaspirillum lusitanum]